MLTGWLGGPSAKRFDLLFAEELLDISLASLANIFHVSASDLKRKLLHAENSCWNTQDYTKGGYSYSTVKSIRAKEKLLKPVQDTLYFAGEAFYEGELQGTVEAALESGRSVAHKMMKSFNL